MSSASVCRVNNVYFGAGYPAPTPDLQENDTYFQTDTGLSTGAIILEFVWDGSEWIQAPTGGVSGPQSWTNVSW
jgi:hypothetical protein